MCNISVVLLTYNEEIHLERCLQSLKMINAKVFVVDSFSTDRTREIAEKYGAHFYQNAWVNYATQFNWALDNCPIDTEWVLRLDADEYLCENGIEVINSDLSKLPDTVSAATLVLKRVFMGREIKRMPKIKMIRLFRYGRGRSENRWMDEHIQIEFGDIIDLNGTFVDDNLNNIGWWTTKHNSYSVREAIDLLDMEYQILGNSHNNNLDEQARKKREMKMRYVKSPLFIRSFTYFIYRYLFKLGFLDGKEGFLWHFLQGWWYRTLVDAKVFEIKKFCGDDKEKMKQYIHNNYGIRL
ncbi:glycosyltransferase family 2 protein [Sphingobacterium siyangense]|uniref:glycosyltransferase family 2 protein n=1 Tax=Sphingobacterium siyangense TaxID=459529 RepID=UPI0019665ECB|nr:glycosyltransferase family 2 protein [Sphingobacterium siyangense]QRY58326.1 glycosyltransferase family 2 protein [Sphingobacterium siyangense]